MTEFFGQEIQVLAVGTPVGSMIAYAGDTAPNDWMKCEGQALDKSTYSALFAVLGEKFGTGDGSGSQFNIPDMRGRVNLGADATRPSGSVGLGLHKHGPGSFAAPDHYHNDSHQHSFQHSHSVSGNAVGQYGVIGAAAGGNAVSLSTHHHDVNIQSSYPSEGPWSSGRSVGTTQGADRALPVAGESAEVVAMPPFVAMPYIIKVV